MKQINHFDRYSFSAYQDIYVIPNSAAVYQMLLFNSGMVTTTLIIHCRPFSRRENS